MTLIEIGACSAPRHVVRVNDAWQSAERAPVRSVIDGVAVRISDAERQGCDCASGGELEGVIAGIGSKLQEVEATEPDEGPIRIWIVAASNTQIC